MSAQCPDFLPDNPQHISNINELKKNAEIKACQLIDIILKYKDENKHTNTLQIATSESLTAGLIMATLVDVPYGGNVKYGCFGVYDTDAKRVFNRVEVEDVYTHQCAKEMAVGVLKNSNATIAIAVTGNAMPYNEHADKLGEVFIGIAGYDENNQIIYFTKSINACNENAAITNDCKRWFETANKGNYNDRSFTSYISQSIRYHTVLKAYETCIEFIQNSNPIVPDEIINRKKQISENKNIPNNKYNFGGEGICMGVDNFSGNCTAPKTRSDNTTNLLKYDIKQPDVVGGKNTKRKLQRKMRQRTKRHKCN